ncbi:hypothetical protein N8H72_26095 [Pseudomonas koreensis]|uniref:hypothetical protein n=1 Tax=Pseudomonas koreensis TaxID=198620 RepID=UPI0021C65DB4|nr:hypothetical protein [Pseudomonas koreensis]MCU0093468.1 hypothetical protein [Pseudomonas koreensis]
MSINIQTAQITADLKLFPVLPLGWRTPVKPPGLAHGGLPHSAATSQGFQILIEPVTALLSWIVAAYDVLELVVDTVPTGITRTILPGEEGDRFLMYLPAKWLKNGVNKILYTVTRPSGNSDKSPELNVLLNKPVASVTVTHPASVVIGQPAVVTMTISDARPYDEETLTIGTWNNTFTIDDTKPITNPLTITYPLTAADLQQIGVGNRPVSVVILDQLSNSNVSPTTSITVIAAPPLSVNPSQLTLNGVMVRSGHLRAPNIADAPGNTAVLQVTGGVGPYTFQSSAPQIASVNAQGKVEGMGNGFAVITITDQNGATVTVQVTVTNIYDLAIFHRTDLNYPMYLQQLAANNWIAMTPQIQAALGCYNAPALKWTVQPNPPSNLAWTGPASGSSAQAYNGINGTFSYHNQTVNHPDQGLGFYLKP